MRSGFRFGTRLDGVVVQAVLEHVLDPARVVAEIHRVLRSDGYVFSSIPFMQQVHGGRYDFTRYTALGHRRLFRDFEEVWLGATSGPGMALAWAFRYWLASLVGSRRRLWKLVTVLTPILTFWLPLLDKRLVVTPAGRDAASGIEFVGRKANTPISDRELLRRYDGLPWYG